MAWVFALVLISTSLVQAVDVNVQWDSNEGADYYEVHYGIESKKYTMVSPKIYAPATQCKLTGLEERTWYFSIVAVNKKGEASDFSDEIIYTPPPKPKSVFAGLKNSKTVWGIAGGILVLLVLVLGFVIRKRS
jgi:hypothetical protein